MPKYYKRYIEKLIEKKLKSAGAVLAVGSIFCGKTTTCSLYAKSVYRIKTRSIVHLKNKILNKSDIKAPSFMMVLTSFGPCYKRKDGIYIVPINLLKN